MSKLKSIKKKKGNNLTIQSILKLPKEKRTELYRKIDMLNLIIDKKIAKIATQRDLDLFLLLNLAWSQDTEIENYK